MPVDPSFCALFLIAAFIMAGIAQTVVQGADLAALLDPARCRPHAARPPAVRSAQDAARIRCHGPNRLDRVRVTGVCDRSPRERGSVAIHDLAIRVSARGPHSASWRVSCRTRSSKRQLDIAPGGIGTSSTGRFMQLVIDRLDSAGMLAALSVVVTLPALTWAIALLVGPMLHGFFSFVMFQLGLKARPSMTCIRVERRLHRSPARSAG